MAKKLLEVVQRAQSRYRQEIVFHKGTVSALVLFADCTVVAKNGVLRVQ